MQKSGRLPVQDALRTLGRTTLDPDQAARDALRNAESIQRQVTGRVAGANDGLDQQDQPVPRRPQEPQARQPRRPRPDGSPQGRRRPPQGRPPRPGRAVPGPRLQGPRPASPPSPTARPDAAPKPDAEAGAEPTPRPPNPPATPMPAIQGPRPEAPPGGAAKPGAKPEPGRPARRPEGRLGRRHKGQDGQSGVPEGGKPEAGAKPDAGQTPSGAKPSSSPAKRSQRLREANRSHPKAVGETKPTGPGGDPKPSTPGGATKPDGSSRSAEAHDPRGRGAGPKADTHQKGSPTSSRRWSTTSSEFDTYRGVVKDGREAAEAAGTGPEAVGRGRRPSQTSRASRPRGSPPAEGRAGQPRRPAGRHRQGLAGSRRQDG